MLLACHEAYVREVLRGASHPGSEVRDFGDFASSLGVGAIGVQDRARPAEADRRCAGSGSGSCAMFHVEHRPTWVLTGAAGAGLRAGCERSPSRAPGGVRSQPRVNPRAPTR